VKSPLRLADLFDLRPIADPQLSPDGQWVAYVVTATDLAETLHNSDIYLVPAEGRAAFKLTNGPKRDDTPRWFPDGQRIAFISGREQKDQV